MILKLNTMLLEIYIFGECCQGKYIETKYLFSVSIIYSIAKSLYFILNSQ